MRRGGISTSLAGLFLMLVWFCTQILWYTLVLAFGTCYVLFLTGRAVYRKIHSRKQDKLRAAYRPPVPTMSEIIRR
jgi:hypothetical protein